MARGDIVRAQLPMPSNRPGHEQIGTRPVLIVHNDTTSNNQPVVMVIPFTSQQGATRFPHTITVQPTAQNGLTMESILLVSQLRAIDVRRLGATLGRLERDIMSVVDDEMRSMLDL